MRRRSEDSDYILVNFRFAKAFKTSKSNWCDYEEGDEFCSVLLFILVFLLPLQKAKSGLMNLKLCLNFEGTEVMMNLG